MSEIAVSSSQATSASRSAPAVSDAAPAITFDRVRVSYGRGKNLTDALIDFDLRVSVGETVALLGPSGSGKSTALNALAGFVRPTAGRVRLSGRDVTDLPPSKRGIGVVLQSYALFPHMRVAENVAFGLKSHRVARREIGPRVAEALDMVGMGSFGKRLPRELSGGQQQRVAIARALAIRPKVLLLDEPLAALDARLRQSMLAELQQLKEALPDTAMLYVTHDQAEALALADRVVVMNDARLMDVDTAQNLWTRPPTSFTASFLGGANLIPCTIGRVIGTSALVSIAHKTVSAEAPQPAVGKVDWAPGARALLCIRPHVLQIVGLGHPEALRATVNASVWRGATTRVVLSVDGVADRTIEVDAPGHTGYAVGTEVGLRFPQPAGVLVQVGR
ncbi:ABC transporter ATP-binding protein [Mycolicibacterium rhodesiae]|uniref:ABC-type quaternary amine transporter n=1 Tax=Mycolicibacterium rhodesiae TaxID=36814 RepID=A0A1X0IW06_MYCRH|nr:ABC transporter ATP-binding protein [Mycolicibacterium rhodesiae]ORB52830.1 phosphonate ABC transporter ATP-binding protein [Mycolicibacterium rhodesiae]